MSKELKNIVFIEMLKKFEYDDLEGMLKFVNEFKSFLGRYYQLIYK